MPTKKIYNQNQSILKAEDPKLRALFGFTLMEIIVATTIFAVVATALMSLFNYTLKINRRGEALRQATQGMRSFVEFLVKEIRNGQIDYLVVNEQKSPLSPIGPCTAPAIVGDPTYQNKENKLGVITPEGAEECIYFADENGTALPSNVFTAPVNKNYTLVLEKTGGVKQILTPPNFKIENVMFLIRPTKDPYTATGGYVKVQPFVVMMIKFVAQLPTGEKFPIYYQTTVSTNKYDIPNQ